MKGGTNDCSSSLSDRKTRVASQAFRLILLLSQGASLQRAALPQTVNAEPKKCWSGPPRQHAHRFISELDGTPSCKLTLRRATQGSVDTAACQAAAETSAKRHLRRSQLHCSGLPAVSCKAPTHERSPKVKWTTCSKTLQSRRPALAGPFCGSGISIVPGILVPRPRQQITIEALSPVPGGSETPAATSRVFLILRSSKIEARRLYLLPVSSSHKRIKDRVRSLRSHAPLEYGSQQSFGNPGRRLSCQNDGQASRGNASHVRSSQTYVVGRRVAAHCSHQAQSELQSSRCGSAASAWSTREPSHGIALH